MLCLLACLFVVTGSWGQSAQTDPAPVAGVSDLDARMERIQADPDLPQAIKALTIEFYQRARESAALIRQFAEELSAINQLVASAPEQIEALGEELQEPTPVDEIPAYATVDELKTLVSRKQAEMLIARDALKALEAASAELAQSENTLVDVFAERERNLQKIQDKLASVATADEPPVVGRAREADLMARQALEEVKLDLLRVRATNRDLLAELSGLRIDIARNSVGTLEAEIGGLTTALQREREMQASVGRLEAAASLASTTGLSLEVQAVAEQDAALKAELEELIGREAALNESLQSTSNRFRDLEDNLRTLRERVSTYGASQAIGRLLQRRLGQLSQTWDFRQGIRERRKELTRITDRRIDIEDERLNLADFDATVDAIMASMSSELEVSELTMVREQVVGILKAKRDTLTDLNQAYGRYMVRLIAIDALEDRIEETAQETKDFIRKQLTWIPSLPPLSSEDFTHTPETLSWLLSPRNWAEAARDAVLSFVNRPLMFGAFAIVLVVVFGVRARARRRLPEIAEQARRIRTDAFSLTWHAFGYTLAAALALPMLLAFIGTLLEAEPTPKDSVFSLAIGDSLWNVSLTVYVLTLLRWLTAPYGLGSRHFRWHTGVCESLHANLLWLAWIVVPLVFAADVSRQQLQVDHILGVGRPALMLALLAIAVFVLRVFSRSGLFLNYLHDRPDGWPARLWVVWFPVFVGVPVGLCVLSGFGFQVAARVLSDLIFEETVWLLLGLLLINEMLIRWFKVAERSSRIEAALRQREEARAEREHEGEEEGGASGFEIDIPEVDYRSLGEQARTVIRVGVFLGLLVGVGTIWGDLVPTLGLLERVELPFSKQVMLDGIAQQIPVNLADILFSILMLAGALFAAQNLSGVLEFTILRRLKFDAGGNYAIVTLCKYVIVAIGVIAGFSAIGLQWSKLQWLIAAMGVGLGFGLQEIVANFVSGIILLLERPVRVGDIVTVGGADGVVSRIRIRATTILTWERKELIIPNKEFITGQVLNWTLSDSLTRILINVGVAYGSDVNEALALLQKVAQENRLVLEEPEPIVTFEAFGDNALMLYVRCYIASADDRLAVMTALHKAINEEFAEAGIAIAFPQRDIHLDTAKPLEITIRRSPSAAASKRRP